MACEIDVLRGVPLFALLDDEELAVLANQVEFVRFAARQRIYKIGDPGEQAYVMLSGAVQVTTIDDDNQDVIVDEPRSRRVLRHGVDVGPNAASDRRHRAVEETTCLRVDRNDILVLLHQKPHAGMDMLTVLGRQFHAAQRWCAIALPAIPTR